MFHYMCLLAAKQNLLSICKFDLKINYSGVTLFFFLWVANVTVLDEMFLSLNSPAQH